MAAAPKAKSKQIGEDVEERAVAGLDALDPVETDDSTELWYDAITSRPITPADGFPMVGLVHVDEDTEVETKATKYRLSDGNGYGRIHIRKNQHEKLLDAGGVYLLVVYLPHNDRTILARLFVPARLVEEVRNDWYEVTGRETYTQVRWTTLPFSLEPGAVETDREFEEGDRDE